MQDRRVIRSVHVTGFMVDETTVVAAEFRSECAVGINTRRCALLVEEEVLAAL